MQDDHNDQEVKLGRPTKYKGSDTDRKAKSLALLGLQDTEIADQLEVSLATLNLWKLQHKSFSESLTEGKVAADAYVAEALYHKAIGNSATIEHNEVLDSNGEVRVLKKVRKHAPDTAAAFIWLKNRNPNRWKDRQEVVSTNLNIFNVSLEQAKKGALELLDPFRAIETTVSEVVEDDD